MVKKKMKEGALELICRLSEMLGVDIKKPEYSVTTPKESGKIKMHDGSLKIEMFPHGLIEIEGVTGMGLELIHVDNYRKGGGQQYYPENALYVIHSYFSRPETKETVPGVIYIGRDGKLINEGKLM